MTRRYALTAILAALLAPVAGAAEALTLVAFGDSTTAPRGPTQVYAELLSRELSVRDGELKVLNAGNGGNTTRQAKQRLEQDVIAHQPHFVIIQFGINDSAVDVWKDPPVTTPRVDLPQYRGNLAGIIRTLKARGTRVILMTPNSLTWSDRTRTMYGAPPYDRDKADGFNVLLRDYAQAVRDLAREQRVAFIDVYAAFAAHQAPPQRPLTSDGMHPNSDGHRLIANLLLDHLTAADPRFHRLPPPK